MTNDEIMQVAKEAGFNYAYASMWQDELEHLAAIIEKRTIERCANECEKLAWRRKNSGLLGPEINKLECAAAIRKLGEQ